MSIKPFKTIEEQYQLLLDRGLEIPNKEFFVNYILKNNYFNVINGHEDLLLENAGKGSKYYDTATFDDFVRLHSFDKILSNHLIGILYSFESSLRSSISKNFSEMYCRTPENTMQYTNKKNYLDIHKRFGDNYTLYHDQNHNVVNQFEEFILFKTGFLKNLVSRNDFVNEKVFSVNVTEYAPPSGCNSYKVNSVRHVVVPLWVAIETFDFGTLQRFCHYLTSNVLNNVLADFNLKPTDREMFLNSLDVIRELRNNCAHFTLINRFSTSLYVKVLPGLISYLNLKPIEKSRKIYVHALKRSVRKNAAKLNLYDTLKVLGLYENLSILKAPLERLIHENNEYFKRNTYDLNARVLERMGNKEYSDWEILFS